LAKDVLVVGRECTTSLALVRSLYSKYDLWISSDEPAYSRFWAGRLGYMSVRDIIELDDFSALIPIGFREVAPLVYAGSSRLPWEDWKVFVKAHDKSYLSESWSGKYPCAVKPKSWCGATKVYKCNTPEERDEAIRKIRGLQDDPPLSDATPLIQDWWPGEIYDVVLLAVKGEIWGAMVQRRVITHPAYPHGGPGCLNVTVDPNKPYSRRLLERAQEIVAKIKWTGPAQLEFRSGHLVEMNAKLWGTYPLSVAAGHDFSEAIVRLAMGKNLPEPPGSYRAGVWCGFWPTMLKERSFFSLRAWKTALMPAIRMGDMKPEMYAVFSPMKSLLMSTFGRAM